MAARVRNLIVILGDQLDQNSAALKDFDSDQDLVWMAEVAEESKHVWSHKARIVLFLSAMRHFRNGLEKKKLPVLYRQLDDRGNKGSLSAELCAAIKKHKPDTVKVVWPGDHRVLEMLRDVTDQAGVELVLLDDTHFVTTLDQFRKHAEGRKQLRMEFFYREVRKQMGVLMEGGKPVGGKWNYDADNRKSFTKSGPPEFTRSKRFKPDKITKEVIALVEKKFPEHPGRLDQFDWPVTSKQARAALDDFVENRLPNFGDYQDAMWMDEPYLFHSRISAAMNLKLLDPRDAVVAALAAYQNDEASLAGVEGFIRQIIGWREYVRGIYWLYMPEYLERNGMKAKRDLPEFYWTGETEMNCLSQAIGQTLERGYAHHIQRLMVTGLFSLLLGVDPRQVHEWYLAVYVDAVEWVELPNTLGMSQYADGGVMASKPYVASGKYIQRMSNYCSGCKFDPAVSVGENACPFTTLYWDYLDRHQDVLSQNMRMKFQVKNLERKSKKDIAAIKKQATKLRKQLP